MTATRQRLRLAGGQELSFLTAGDRPDPGDPTLLLLHGFPNAGRMFEPMLPVLAQEAFVVAPDLPGFGESDVLPTTSFPALADAVAELLDHLAVGPRYLYVHDFGAPVALELAMAAPELVLGLVVQNANAHRTGFGPAWAATFDYWAAPTPEHEAAATAHLTFEGTRDQYLADVPPEITSTIRPERWEEDWAVMSRPGRLEAQRALIRDYGRYADRFDEIADYLAAWQPPALLLWGRHDAFFDLAEVESWLRDLPRMEAHVLDAGHLLVETHAEVAASLLVDFVRSTSGRRLVASGDRRGARP